VIVYVETNFLLELTYLQERYASCEEVLELAATNRIVLAVPAFSVAEARATWQRRASERRDFLESLRKHMREVSRSAPFRDLTDRSRDFVAALVASGEEPRERLEEAIHEIESTGVIIPLNSAILAISRVHEILYSLSPQDALVLESVCWHGRTQSGPKCFITQDAKGFANPTVYDELAAIECKVLVNFTDAVAYIRNAIESTG